MEGTIKLGHMDSRENTRKETLRELLALRPPPTRLLPSSLLLPLAINPCRGLKTTQ